jgi:hypothetical protein
MLHCYFVTLKAAIVYRQSPVGALSCLAAAQIRSEVVNPKQAATHLCLHLDRTDAIKTQLLGQSNDISIIHFA